MATYTYSPSRGASLDKARELLGDTPLLSPDGIDLDPELALRSDERIQDVIDREGSAMGVSVLAADLYAEFAQQPVKITSAGDSLDLSKLLTAWAELAAPAWARATAAATAAAAANTTRLARIGQITAGADIAGKLR